MYRNRYKDQIQILSIIQHLIANREMREEEGFKKNRLDFDRTSLLIAAYMT